MNILAKSKEFVMPNINILKNIGYSCHKTIIFHSNFCI